MLFSQNAQTEKFNIFLFLLFDMLNVCSLCVSLRTTYVWCLIRKLQNSECYAFLMQKTFEHLQFYVWTLKKCSKCITTNCLRKHELKRKMFSCSVWRKCCSQFWLLTSLFALLIFRHSFRYFNALCILSFALVSYTLGFLPYCLGILSLCVMFYRHCVVLSFCLYIHPEDQ